jgi:hypothetical protein
MTSAVTFRRGILLGVGSSRSQGAGWEMRRVIWRVIYSRLRCWSSWATLRIKFLAQVQVGLIRTVGCGAGDQNAQWGPLAITSYLE